MSSIRRPVVLGDPRFPTRSRFDPPRQRHACRKSHRFGSDALRGSIMNPIVNKFVTPGAEHSTDHCANDRAASVKSRSLSLRIASLSRTIERRSRPCADAMTARSKAGPQPPSVRKTSAAGLRGPSDGSRTADPTDPRRTDRGEAPGRRCIWGRSAAGDGAGSSGPPSLRTGSTRRVGSADGKDPCRDGAARGMLTAEPCRGGCIAPSAPALPRIRPSRRIGEDRSCPPPRSLRASDR